MNKTVEKINGHEHMGSPLQVEHVQNTKQRRNKIEIRNYPSGTSKDDITVLCEKFGTVLRCDIAAKSGDVNAGDVATISFNEPGDAELAAEKLAGVDYRGGILMASVVNMASNRVNTFGLKQQQQQGQQGHNAMRPAMPSLRGRGYPLRLLVPSDFVGAIIGRRGATIREITTECKARVDVHGKENSGLLEKVISIYGQPDNCTNAAHEILKVMQQESTSTFRGEIVLKMLADDRYCGRIIGKEGKVIKKIREQTDTRITVSKTTVQYMFLRVSYIDNSSVQEVVALYPDRVITVKGSLTAMVAAEAAISTKLRECFDKELQNGSHSMPVPMNGINSSYNHFNQQQQQQQQQHRGNNNYNNVNSYGHQYHYQGVGTTNMSAPAVDVCQISIPNAAVGAIIGSGGSNIKQIIRESNAFVTIEPKPDGHHEEEQGQGDHNNLNMPIPSNERIVTIKGVPDAIWRANYFIFEKLKQEGFAGNEEVRLRTAITVPRTMVGRVIGKAGKNVRDMQRVTGAMIKLPEDQRMQGDDVVVEIFGNFMATQNAQARIRGLVVNQGQPNNSVAVRRRSSPEVEP